MLIKIPKGRVLFLGGWWWWVPMLVIWFTRRPSIELRCSGRIR